MQFISFALTGLSVLGIGALGVRLAHADTATRITGPHVHENLAVYFIHGKSAPGPVPLTLQEAMEKGRVDVLETGTVSELKIENKGDQDIFIQAGDIVKGGKQDRVLTMSFVLPPKSGKVALSAFCVERGRWSARGSENDAAFASAAEAMPSREAKLAMHAPAEPVREPLAGASGAQHVQTDSLASAYGGASRQKRVWDSVARTQSNLSSGLAASVAAPQSATSLQLSLENEKLQKARAAYVEAIEKQGIAADDIVGYAIAINGRISTADVYPSNGLFRKMWDKQLAAGATEALGQKDAAGGAPPAIKEVGAFLAAAEAGNASDPVVNAMSRQEVHDADKALFVEARRSDGSWVHRNYLAK
jgi:hypothetical protein